MKKSFSFSLLFLTIFAACDVSAPITPPAPPAAPAIITGKADSTTRVLLALKEIPLAAGYGVDGGWIQIYFTNPQSPLAAQKTGGIDAPLAAAINSARLTVDVAIYSFSLNNIRDALIRAHKRGARVRVVTESENLDRSDAQKLKDAGVPILGDRREGLMHNKFVVIDNSEVWLGSMNFTDSGAYSDNNNLVRIRSKQMAENFAKEFDEMFVDDKFGDNILAKTPHPSLEINGVRFDVYFSPDDGAQAALIKLLQSAEQSIYFMAFSFTADSVGQVIRDRARQGVAVAGVMETEQVKSNIGTEFDLFKQAGLDVLRDGNQGQMHHKAMIVDEKIVVFGSYNFTNSAETRNDEALVVIYSHEIAAQFMAEFVRIHSLAQSRK